MDKREIKIILNIPSSPLLEHFLSQANLGEIEHTVVLLCLRDGLTQEEAAERMSMDRRTLQRLYKTGAQKLAAYLESMRWLLGDYIHKAS